MSADEQRKPRLLDKIEAKVGDRGLTVEAELSVPSKGSAVSENREGEP